MHTPLYAPKTEQDPTTSTKDTERPSLLTGDRLALEIEAAKRQVAEDARRAFWHRLRKGRR